MRQDKFHEKLVSVNSAEEILKEYLRKATESELLKDKQFFEGKFNESKDNREKSFVAKTCAKMTIVAAAGLMLISPIMTGFIKTFSFVGGLATAIGTGLFYLSVKKQDKKNLNQMIEAEEIYDMIEEELKARENDDVFTEFYYK